MLTENKKAEFTYNDIHATIVDYHWMINELHRLKMQLNMVESVGVASYSDEPGGGGSSNRVETEVIRRSKKWERMERYESRIKFINEQKCIVDEREQVVLDCLLDGIKPNEIAKHMNVDRKTVVKIRDEIFEKIFNSQFS